MRDCFGQHLEAYPKCDSCDEIEKCSAATLIKYLAKRGHKVSTSIGELVMVDE